MNETQKPVTVLRGHTSPDTAYLVNDYPYGFRLRCKIRYWLEFKAGHGTRLMSQTTNPKQAGEPWNKPKGSTYSPGLALMYLNHEQHVMWQTLGGWRSSPEAFIEWEAHFGPLMNDMERSTVQKLLAISRKVNPETWATWDAKQVPAISANLVQPL